MLGISTPKQHGTKYVNHGKNGRCQIWYKQGNPNNTEIQLVFWTVQSDIFIWIHLGYMLDNYSFFWVLLLGCIAHHNHEPCQQPWQPWISICRNPGYVKTHGSTTKSVQLVLFWNLLKPSWPVHVYNIYIYYIIYYILYIYIIEWIPSMLSGHLWWLHSTT